MTFEAITTVAQVDALDGDLLLSGYRAGLDGTPDYTQKDQAYWHGYMNGQVDRGVMPISVEQIELARATVASWRAN